MLETQSSLDGGPISSQWKGGRTAKNREDDYVTVRPFTLRLPEDLYLTMVDRAIASGRTNTAVVIELMEIGLGKKMDIRKALQDLIAREFPDHAITTEG